MKGKWNPWICENSSRNYYETIKQDKFSHFQLIFILWGAYCLRQTYITLVLRFKRSVYDTAVSYMNHTKTSAESSILTQCILQKNNVKSYLKIRQNHFLHLPLRILVVFWKSQEMVIFDRKMFINLSNIKNISTECPLFVFFEA